MSCLLSSYCLLLLLNWLFKSLLQNFSGNWSQVLCNSLDPSLTPSAHTTHTFPFSKIPISSLLRLLWLKLGRLLIIFLKPKGWKWFELGFLFPSACGEYRKTLLNWIHLFTKYWTSFFGLLSYWLTFILLSLNKLILGGVKPRIQTFSASLVIVLFSCLTFLEQGNSLNICWNVFFS